MNEPAGETLDAAGVREFVPQRITGPVLAGVVPGQPLTVVHRAVERAYTLNVKLICAYVDITSYLVDDAEDSIEAGTLWPDGIVDDVEATSAGIRKCLHELLDAAGVRWSFLTLTGDPARALGQLADSANASVIVVGTREPGLGTRLEQLLVGSVAVQLTRGQHRPVVVVPLARQHDPGRTTQSQE
jgi:nucleotide-binding universal stress UspA family protein